ncbi:MAG: hypothetical protein V4714_08255 [Bacteroidota bacterium]
MNYLRAPVSVINSLICARLKDTSQVFGIVKQIRREKDKVVELITVDENNNPVSIDDRYFITIYHKINKINSKAIGGRGKHTTYQLEAEMSLICSSKTEVVHDILLLILSGQKNITYSGSDFDFTKIIRQETGKRDINHENSLFQIDYSIFHQSDRCLDECQMNDLLTASVEHDCIETSQGGVLTP